MMMVEARRSCEDTLYFRTVVALVVLFANLREKRDSDTFPAFGGGGREGGIQPSARFPLNIHTMPLSISYLRLEQC